VNMYLNNTMIKEMVTCKGKCFLIQFITDISRSPKRVFFMCYNTLYLLHLKEFFVQWLTKHIMEHLRQKQIKMR
jgi:hypothetical protein